MEAGPLAGLLKRAVDFRDLSVVSSVRRLKNGRNGRPLAGSGCFEPFQKAPEPQPDLILLEIGPPKTEWNRNCPSNPGACS